MVDFLLVVVIVGILAAVVLFILKSRKKGVTCIGCPDGGQCSGKCSCCSGCCPDADKTAKS